MTEIDLYEFGFITIYERYFKIIITTEMFYSIL